MKNDGGVFDYIFLMIQCMWDTLDCGCIDFSSFQAENGGDGDQAHMQPEYKTPKPTLFSPSLYLRSPPSLPSLSTAPLCIPSFPSPSQLSILTSLFLPLLQQPFITFFFSPSPPFARSPASPRLSSHFCPLQRPSLARQGWLQICSSVPWG